MKSQAKKKKPLVLASEKLRPLTEQELRTVDGGGDLNLQLIFTDTAPKSLPSISL